ncbi:MAG: primase C-terminal domain-containing protein [Bacteroides sp.]|uniref:primase C-terminal domain-containing protein n=1 Tax=Bacteroides sp. TaxID=29523 RepID=UPI002FC8F263
MVQSDRKHCCAHARDAPNAPDSPFSLPTATGFLQGFFADFRCRNTFERGGRNDFLLKLGRVARYKEISYSEVCDLIRMVANLLAKDDLTDKFIEKRIMAGYKFVDSSPVTSGDRAQAHKVQGSLYDPPGGDGAEE